MKKLLALLLVLGMATMANATVTLTMDDDTCTTASPSGTLEVNWSTDASDVLISIDVVAYVSASSGTGTLTLSNPTCLSSNRDTLSDYYYGT